MITREQFRQLRQSGKTVEEIKAMDQQGKVVPSSLQMSNATIKQPNILSRVTGVASRAMEVPGALVGMTGSNIYNFSKAATTGDWNTFVKELKTLSDKLYSIPGEVSQGWSEGITKSSDMYSVSQAMGQNKNDVMGAAIDLLADLATPGGVVKQGSKLGMKFLGKEGGTLSRAGKQFSGVVKPVFNSVPGIPGISELPRYSTKASDSIKAEIAKMSKVDFGSFAEDSKKAFAYLGKNIGGKIVGKVETLNNKAAKYGVPTSDWASAKIYIENAKDAAGKMVTQLGKTGEKLDYGDFTEMMKKEVNDIRTLYGPGEYEKARATVINWVAKAKGINMNEINNLPFDAQWNKVMTAKGGSVNTGYDLRNILDEGLAARKKMGQFGQSVMNSTDLLMDKASMALRTKLNQFEPLRLAQEKYHDLEALSRRSSEIMAENAEKSTKLKEKLPQVVKEEVAKQQEAWDRIIEQAKKRKAAVEEANRMIAQRYENAIDATSPQKTIGKFIRGKSAIGGVPQLTGMLPGILNRVIQPFKDTNTQN